MPNKNVLKRNSSIGSLHRIKHFDNWQYLIIMLKFYMFQIADIKNVTYIKTAQSVMCANLSNIVY